MNLFKKKLKKKEPINRDRDCTISICKYYDTNATNNCKIKYGTFHCGFYIPFNDANEEE